MTGEQATAIVAEIKRLASSHHTQVAVEFEGHDPGMSTPQLRTCDELAAQINSSGTHAYKHGTLVERSEFARIRETFNGRLRSFQVANPGRKITTGQLATWEDEAGMKAHVLKSLAAIFDAH